MERELCALKLLDAEPCNERVLIFSKAFSEVIDMLPSYRPFLLCVQREYEGLVNKLEKDINAIVPIEGRIKTLKAEGLSMIGESMTCFQIEMDCLRRKLAASEDQFGALKKEKHDIEIENARLREESERDRSLAVESHAANRDIQKHLDRAEKQVELLRKQEKEMTSEIKSLTFKIKERDTRIGTVEDQLTAERTKITMMVPREEHEAVQEDLALAETRLAELKDELHSKQKELNSILDVYLKAANQSVSEKDKMRPLTPRPTWHQCKGLFDVEPVHSTDKAEAVQDLLQHVFINTRTLLTNYGLNQAAQKSAVARASSCHPSVAPIVYPERERTVIRQKTRTYPTVDEGNDCAGDTITGAKATPATRQEDMIPADTDPSTPEQLRHSAPIKNMNFSRRKVTEFIEGMMLDRSRHGPQALTTPFLNYMLEHLPDTLIGEEKFNFAVNIFAAVRQYSAEPDFLAFSLLLEGTLPDALVKDNRNFCSELLRIFSSNLETEDGSTNITRQKLIECLREVLQHKDKEKWKEIILVLPAGGPVNYEVLLFDDPYVPSPLVYALRLQHLDEVIALSQRLEKTVQSCCTPDTSLVKFELLEATLAKHPEFELIALEDYAHAFGVHTTELCPELEQEAEMIMTVFRQADLFKLLCFPMLGSHDEGDIGMQREIS